MNERGFVTIFALCMILVIALAVKGIQENETNHNYAATDLQIEFDLQNAADGSIYEAAELVRENLEQISRNPESNPALDGLLPANSSNNMRKNYQRELLSRTIETLHGKISVTVWGERLKIQGYERKYTSNPYNKSSGAVKYGYILFSVATMDSDRFGKIYRRAFAYVIDGYGIEFHRETGNNGNKVVEPRYSEEIDGKKVSDLYYVDKSDKYSFFVRPEDKNVVHFMEPPSGAD